MALFSVSRYMGEETTDIDKNEKDLAASKILEKIKTEAKQRKAERKSKNQKAIENDSSTNDKREEVLEPEPDEDKSYEKKKKKKKRKAEDETTEVDESSCKKMKKKKLKSNEHGEEKEQKIENEFDVEEEKLSDEHACTVDMKGKDNVDVGDNTIEMDNEERFPVLGNFKHKTVQKVNRVLPDWLASPNIITADLRSITLPVGEMTGLDPDLVVQLRENNISHFFPVQMQVMPMLLDTLSGGGGRVGKAGYWPSDICVSAPTGSGKTLAFVLPIIQALKGRVHRQVCALAVLPVRDLALQVYKVFQTYSKGSDLKVGLLTGQKAFKLEQQTLVRRSLRGYQSLVDIIVATPGRLVDHINQTPGFDLSSLRFLVIDEADKMMELIKQDWLVRVENAVYKNTRPQPEILTPNSCLKPHIPLQKLLFSATLSQNPEKLQQLNLFVPKLFTSLVKPGNITPVYGADTGQAADTEENRGEFVGKYTTPQGLSEYFVECTAATKPLLLIHFLHSLMFTNVLCFVNSVESTHRLYHLIRLVGGKEVREFSSGLQTNRRKRILKEFANGKIDIIICTDAMARGMDIDNVKFVISYDQTPNIKTYIHRVGRTARAGKVGTAITLLQNKEFYHFKKMTKEAGKPKIREQKVSEEALEPIIPAFKKALEEVPHILKAEKMKKNSNG